MTKLYIGQDNRTKEKDHIIISVATKNFLTKLYNTSFHG